MDAFFSFFLGYICGAIPFGLMFTRMAGLGDIRTSGSGNIGATNVLRTGNKTIALLTLLADAFKGIFPIIILHSILRGALSVYAEGVFGFSSIVSASHVSFLSALCGFGALLGHMFPFWLGFRGGGKGVATFFGLVAILCPWSVFIAVSITWLLVAAFSRYSSLSSLVATVSAPLWSFFFSPSESHWFMSEPFFLLLCALLIWWRHRSNIERLYLGIETKIGEKNNV